MSAKGLDEWKEAQQKYGRKNASTALKLLKKKKEWEQMKAKSEWLGRENSAIGYQMWIDEVNLKLVAMRLNPE